MSFLLTLMTAVLCAGYTVGMGSHFIFTPTLPKVGMAMVIPIFQGHEVTYLEPTKCPF